MEKNYDYKKIEEKIYPFWENTGFFNPDNLPKENKEPYTIMLPPPNVTGELHMGHALNATVQDILIRQKRMQGYKTLWLPGTDHAGIATQNVVEKKLKKEGKTRFDLGRDKFIEEVWDWKEKSGNAILKQLKKIGVSCDWSRTRFTMDEDYTEAVKKSFLHYYKKGLIYKDKRVINWCPRCSTSLSDLELEYEEEKGNLWFIKYKVKGEENYVTVATTRPETMLGDTAIAVNPEDERYKKLTGKKVILPLVEKEIPVVSDHLIDKEFGTGVLKVTPAHDPKDYEIGIKNNLEKIQIIDESAKITKEAPEKYQGLTVLEARKEVLADLGELVSKKEDLAHQVPTCYRCHSKIEVILSDQWFLKMKELAKKAKIPVEKGEIKFHPSSFKKTYIDWLDNVRDWCISRQIWWGHKVPIENESDVLDTWFSSALWPFATLGWPEKTNDLKEFYPTDVLCTGRDIINFWVVRMIFSGLTFLDKKPFKHVYINPTILAADGRRMSKSLGTGVNPMDLIEKYGSDATRFGLSSQAMGNQDLKFTEDSLIRGKKFCNKIWNASRFVLQQIENTDFENTSIDDLPKNDLTESDKKIISQMKETVKSINENLKKFQFGHASEKIYDFFWHDFCDQYIEASKKQDDKKTKIILLSVLTDSLKLLHPFTPFITEEIYQKLPLGKKESLIIENWPKC